MGRTEKPSYYYGSLSLLWVTSMKSCMELRRQEDFLEMREEWNYSEEYLRNFNCMMLAMKVASLLGKEEICRRLTFEKDWIEELQTRHGLICSKQ